MTSSKKTNRYARFNALVRRVEVPETSFLAVPYDEPVVTDEGLAAKVTRLAMPDRGVIPAPARARDRKAR